MRIRARISAVLLMGIMLSMGCGDSNSKAGQKAVATVAGKPVYEKDVLQRWETLKKQRLQNQNLTDKQMENLKNKYFPQLTDQAINEAIYNKTIDDMDIGASGKEINGRYDQLKKSKPDINKLLKKQGLSVKDAKKTIATQIKITKMYNNIVKDVEKPSEKEIKKFYDDNINAFKAGRQVKASHIILRVAPGVSDDVRKEKRAEISKILEKARAGADFAELARKYSEGPSAKNGGELGYFGKGQMVAPFEKAAFSLKKGQISDIVETRFGYHIIKVSDIKEAGTMPFKEVKDRIENRLLQQKQQEKFKEWLEAERKELVKYPEKAPEEPKETDAAKD